MHRRSHQRNYSNQRHTNQSPFQRHQHQNQFHPQAAFQQQGSFQENPFQQHQQAPFQHHTQQTPFPPHHPSPYPNYPPPFIPLPPPPPPLVTPSIKPPLLLDPPFSQLEHYTKLSQCGQGTYGKVYKAMYTPTQQLVALKRIRLERHKEGFPVTAGREIRFLKKCRHPHIVALWATCTSPSSIYLVFDYVPYDLSGLLTCPLVTCTESDWKLILWELCDALYYLHEQCGIIHRDIKSANVLITAQGHVQLADFGLARLMTKYHWDQDPCWTNRVMTLWYRAPELLLGCTQYSSNVDVWSVGYEEITVSFIFTSCIFLELIKRKPPFTGHDEISQWQQIMHLLGKEACLNSALESMPWYKYVSPFTANSPVKHCLGQKYPELSTTTALEFIQSLLCLDPNKRWTSQEIRFHSYWHQAPTMASYWSIPPELKDYHEWESKLERKQ